MNLHLLQKRVLASTIFIPAEFIFTVKTDNLGTSATNQFTLPTTGSGFDCIVSWGDNTSNAYVGSVGTQTHTYPSIGTYEIKISGIFPRIFFNNAGDRRKVLEIKNFGIYAGGSTLQVSAFLGCNNMVINSLSIGNFENVTNFSNAFRQLTNLTDFPFINTSNALRIDGICGEDVSLTSFPLIDTSKVTEFSTAWIGCTALQSFPLLNTGLGEIFTATWRGCSNLISLPALNFNSATNFSQAWFNCSALVNFPPNLFDNCTATNFTTAFSTTNLSETSIDNILVSINTANTSNGTFGQSGGTAPSIATGRPAIDALRLRGWTVVVTGGY